MSSGSTDFGAHAVGSAPSGWTPQWVTADGAWVVRAAPDSLSGKVLVPEFTVGGRRAISWDAVAPVQNIELLALVRATAPRAEGLTTNRVIMMGGGGAGGERGVFTTVAGSAHSLNAYLPTEGTVQMSPTPPDDGGSSARYWVRIRHELAETENNYIVKVWPFGGTEQGLGTFAPQGQTNGERSLVPAGWVGFGTFSPDSGTAFEYLSYSTDAAPAPLPGDPVTETGDGDYELVYPLEGQLWPLVTGVKLRRKPS